MPPITILKSRLDPSKILVLALVYRDGEHTVETYQIKNTEEALRNLLHGLYGSITLVRQFVHPIALQGVKRCVDCGRIIIGYDDPELFN